jgi:hypothetical protein
MTTKPPLQHYLLGISHPLSHNIMAGKEPSKHYALFLSTPTYSDCSPLSLMDFTIYAIRYYALKTFDCTSRLRELLPWTTTSCSSRVLRVSMMYTGSKSCKRSGQCS